MFNNHQYCKLKVADVSEKVWIYRSDIAYTKDEVWSQGDNTCFVGSAK
jgi:hypothetical protein